MSKLPSSFSSVLTQPLRTALAPLAAALLLAGCMSTTPPGATPPPAVQSQHNQILEEAAARAANDAQLHGQAQQQNARAIMQLINSLDDASLQRYAQSTDNHAPLYNYLGQALLWRDLPLPKAFVRNNWPQRSTPASNDGYRPPLKIAVLLPLTGNLATAAAPVRDGLMAGYFSETRQRPDLMFYDTAASGGAANAYARAVSEGNDYVIGPLARNEVDALFTQAQLSAPVLALNRGNVRPPAGSAAFSLSPDDEGINAAKFLYGQGVRRVLVISSNDETLQRTAHAFAETFNARGGQVQHLLSEQQLPNLSSYLLPDAPVDAVFLALRTPSTMAAMPYLAMAGLGQTLRVGTSQLANSTSEQSAALESVIFPTESWSVRNVAALPASVRLTEGLPTARGSAARLFAFGFDAWRLSAYLDLLARDPNARLDGATGQLSIDGFGDINRRPAWVRFQSGTPVPYQNGRH